MKQELIQAILGYSFPMRERFAIHDIYPTLKIKWKGSFCDRLKITSLKINLYSQNQPSKELEYAQYLKKLP